MNQAKLDEIRELLENISPGPWKVANDNRDTEYFPFWVIGGNEVEDGEWFMELHVGHKSDADFVAQARELVPELLDEVEQIERKYEKALEEWEEIEQSYIDAEKKLERKIKQLRQENEQLKEVCRDAGRLIPNVND